MKATARFLAGLASVVLGLSVGACLAGPLSIGNALSVAAPGANQGDRSEEARRRSDDLLKRARQAMEENDLKAAESLVAQAEALGADYSLFYQGDTPKKARRDLERQLKASSGTPHPGRLYPPASLGQGNSAVTDPFAARKAAATPADDANRKLAAEIVGRGARADATPASFAPGSHNITPLPTVQGAVPLGPPTMDRSRSDQLLLAARRALAEGDVRRATDMVQQAKALGVQYGATDDSPAKVEALVRDFSDLTSRRDTQGNTDGYRSRYARLLIEQAEGFLPYRDYDKADELATLAAQQGVTFGPYQPNPNDLLKRIAEARRQDRLSASMTSGAGSRQVVPATGSPHYDRTATPALYDQAHDRTRNVLVNTQEPTPAPATGAMPPQPAGPAGAASVGESLFQQGETALMAHDTAKALDYFRQAANHSDQLDPITAQRLQGRLQMLSPPGTTPALPSPLIDQATAAQRNLYQQVAVEVAHQEGQAKAMRENDPKRALALLEETRKNVEAAGLEPPVRDRLLARLDRSLADMQQYIEQNRARIDLEERNQRTREEIDRQQKMTLDVQEKIALLVDEYNQLMHEQRFGEAEVVAKRITELDPQNAFAAQLVEVARLTRRHFSNLALQDEKESAFWETMNNVDKAGTPFDDNKPYVFGDIHTWRELTDRRLAARTERGRRRTERELEIERKLQTPVLLQFENAPLSQVVEYLARVAAVNIHLDAQGLADEGVTSNDPVTINIGEEISLRSALNLILDPLHLGYVIKDEVLKITSEQYREGDLYQVVYNVADLVVPIPNFVPSTGMGLAGAYHDAMGSIGFGGHGPFGGVGSPLAVVASRSGAPNSALVSPTVLAQMPSAQPGPTSAGTMPTGFGPGGLGGGAMADFDSLIELITTTVAPESWDDVGGPGSIAPFPTNLSLVVSQTQEVHDQLADLLEQLRKMQDLQVTIEVRFITLNDNFFERIGIDFDFDINDNVDRPFQVFGRADPTQSTTYATGLFNVGTGPPRDVEDTDHNNPDTVTVGLQQPGVFSADLDIPFTQNSFGLAIPQFGGFDATAGAQMGFAILSDLEAYFFINAAQGDRRSNVMQAPKVTLFNGQQAFVSDTSQSPFVISVIPVVGDFAAAQQPVIVVLSEGTFLTVQAVVSDDRRFVRLTVVPFFSRIGDVNTFTFEGSETTTENSSQQGNQDEPNDNTSKSNRSTVARSGTTVQLPTFSYVTVTTTVSVPDGGTVLLGGIKRLSEGRNEFGVPMLNKLPYVNRLFKNVGIGRETQSLMMTVTPRIIIQEEEEEALGIVTPP